MGWRGMFWIQDPSMRGVSTRDLCTPNPGILRGPFAAVGPVSRGGGRVCQSLATLSVLQGPAAHTTPWTSEVQDLRLHPAP